MEKPVHAMAGMDMSILFCLSWRVPLSLSAFMRHSEAIHMGMANTASASVATSLSVKLAAESELTPLTLQ